MFVQNLLGRFRSSRHEVSPGGKNDREVAQTSRRKKIGVEKAGESADKLVTRRVDRSSSHYRPMPAPCVSNRGDNCLIQKPGTTSLPRVTALPPMALPKDRAEQLVVLGEARSRLLIGDLKTTFFETLDGPNFDSDLVVHQKLLHGLGLFFSKRYGEAADLFEQALAVETGNRMAGVYRAVALQKDSVGAQFYKKLKNMTSLQLAQAELDAFDDISPASSDWMARLVKLGGLFDIGDEDVIEQTLQELVDEFPETTVPHTVLVSHYVVRSFFDESLNSYHRAKEESYNLLLRDEGNVVAQSVHAFTTEGKGTGKFLGKMEGVYHRYGSPLNSFNYGNMGVRAIVNRNLFQDDPILFEYLHQKDK